MQASKTNKHRIAYRFHFLALLPAAFYLRLCIFCYTSYVTGYECHSCLRSCETTPDGRLDPEICDCAAGDPVKNNTGELVAAKCTGNFCFAKVEHFPDESIVIIQKGCVEGLVKGLRECHYAGQPESVHCYCEGHFCNNRIDMNSYLPKPLPILECCECSQTSGDICPKDSCLRTCRGNYCLTDFDGVEQGCGLGVPRLQSFLRIPNYLESLQGETTCAKYQATFSTSVHGCVCTKPTGMCNALEDMTQYQLEHVVKRRIDDQNYCYSIHQRNYERPFDEGVFNKSETCEGHYCFIVLTTSELVVEVRNKPSNATNAYVKAQYTGKSATRYEILAGCLKVDDDKKVSLGCTTEYTGEDNVLSKHCICDSHLCNYYNVVADSAHSIDKRLLEEVKRSPTNIMHDAADVPLKEAVIHPHHSSASSCWHRNFRFVLLMIVTISMFL